MHELDNRLVPIFLRGPNDACRGRQHEFHTLREPSVRVSRFLSLFGCFASVLPALASSFLGILGVREAYHASKRCGPLVLHSSSHSVRRGAMAQQQAAAETRG